MFANAQILFINVLRGVRQIWAVDLPLLQQKGHHSSQAKNADEEKSSKGLWWYRTAPINKIHFTASVNVHGKIIKSMSFMSFPLICLENIISNGTGRKVQVSVQNG